MVSHQQRSAVPRSLIGGILSLAVVLPTFGQEKKGFYPDDPLLREPPPHPVRQVATRHVDDVYDFLENSFATPRRQGKTARQGPHRAADVNTLGDVPESGWYTNRHFYQRMSIEELKRGPGNNTPPANGMWRVVAAKTNGVTPGFLIEDENKNRYLLKLDPPAYPELASGADVIGSKALYALGYNTPENYIVHFRRESLKIAESVRWRDASGRKHPLTARVVDQMLNAQPKAADGTYRGMASRLIEGKLAGPFSYEGTRSDDPNDTVPHEDRRELRGLYVFASWLNHHDTKSVNSMDSLVDENGLRYLKHYLIDFGDILGSNGVFPKHPWSGHQYTIEPKSTAVAMLTFGFYVPTWARSDYPTLTGVGRFESRSFDPISWRPNYPNPAFLLMDFEDAFWAAKQVAAFTDAEIRALVDTGQYSDPRASQWIAESLMKRRDKIAEAWFSRVLPLDRFRVVNGELTFADLGAAIGRGAVGEYVVRWAAWDRNGKGAPLPHARGWRVPDLSGDTEYLVATISNVSENTTAHPLSVYVRRGRIGPEVVAVDR